ncbi:hypothetical protein CPB83DRAFT_878428 [Crepidotus variabilis]|uniref:histone deacetylase n=1 Tax=Crepidotus variabilis TaxID=179855 RepID=A0A9P6JI28_9AGAR|nr:hypothetical protein CPB83DRAFT_878428 [Crepidotus variabilis]
MAEAVGSSSSVAPVDPMRRIVYVVSQELVKISSLLPSNKKRSILVHSLINSLGLLNPKFSEKKRVQVVTPRKATYKDLAVYHTRDYLEAVLNPKNGSLSDKFKGLSVDAVEIDREFGLEDDCPIFPGLSEYIQLVGGATLTAVAAIQQNLASVAICWDGGRHHARKDQAAGFCYVADCILAILALKKAMISVDPVPLMAKTLSSDEDGIQAATQKRKPRIMYLDLDLHFSDAVSEAFYAPRSTSAPQILTLSIHHTSPGFYPSSSRSSLPPYDSPSSSTIFDPLTLSIPLLLGASAKTYHWVFTNVVERIRSIFDPDYVIVQSGVDALAGDPCGTFNWCLDREVEGSMGWCVERIVREWRGKKVLLGGGGYNSPNAARAWAYLTSITLDNPLDLETSIPDHNGFPLYEPSFTLDVPAGNMTDHNSDEYLSTIETCYENVYIALRERLDV